MKYVEVPPIQKVQAERVFSNGSPSDVANALLSLALYDSDWQWVQDRCLDFLESANLDVRNVAITCLGHLARIHGSIDREKVIAALLDIARTDPQLSGKVEDAIDDIEMFAPEKIASVKS